VPGSSRSDAIWHSGASRARQSGHAYSPKAPHFPPRMFHVGRNFFARVSQFTPKFHLIKMRGVSEAWRSASKGKVGDGPIVLGFSSYFFLCDGRGGEILPVKKAPKVGCEGAVEMELARNYAVDVRLHDSSEPARAITTRIAYQDNYQRRSP
jgi:hypothetical protein